MREKKNRVPHLPTSTEITSLGWSWGGFSPRIGRYLIAPASCMGGVAGRRPFLLPQSGERSVTSWVAAHQSAETAAA